MSADLALFLEGVATGAAFGVVFGVFLSYYLIPRTVDLWVRLVRRSTPHGR